MSKTIDLSKYFTSYGTKNIKVQCRAEGFKNSPITELAINNAPHIQRINSHTIKIGNILTDVTQIDLYINDELLTTINHDSTSNEYTVDLSEYTLPSYFTTYTIAHVGDETFTSDIYNSSVVLGVSGLYQSDPALTRTYDAVGMSYVIDSSTGQVSSDFDDVFPYSEMVDVTIGDNVFVKIPSMWFKVVVDNSNRITDIAVSKYKMDNEDNWYQTEEFYYGKYNGYVNSSKLVSKSGYSVSSNYSFTNCRTYATANGSGYHQLSIYNKTILNFLWLIEFANKNSQSIMTGYTNYHASSTISTGETNVITTHSGYLTPSMSNNQYRMKYHGIEDFIGGRPNWLDGNHGAYYTSNPNNFSTDTTGKTKLSYTPSSSDGYITAFGWDPNNPFICLPITLGGSSSTYFCDQNYYYGSTTSTGYYYFCGASCSNSSTEYGVFYMCHYNSTRNDVIGRLCYTPSATAAASESSE